MYEKFTREKVAVTARNRLKQIIFMIEEKGIDYYRKKAANYIKIHDLEQSQEKIDAILARIQAVNHIDASLNGVLKSIGRTRQSLDRIEKLAKEVSQRSQQSHDAHSEGESPDKKGAPPVLDSALFVQKFLKNNVLKFEEVENIKEVGERQKTPLPAE